MSLLNRNPPRSNTQLLFYRALTFLAIWALILPQTLAQAADTSQPALTDHDLPTLNTLAERDFGLGADDDAPSEGDATYAPDFAYFERSIIGRQESQINKLVLDVKTEKDINPGAMIYFVLEANRTRTRRAQDDFVPGLEGDHSGADDDRELESDEDKEYDEEQGELRKRQSPRTIVISANTCRQPTFNGTQPPDTSPQLVMYLSTSQDNQKPGPNSTRSGSSTAIPFDSGYAAAGLSTDSNVYIGISAPSVDKTWFGSWHFEIAISSTSPYHSFNDTDPFLYLVDTDGESTLFITYGLGNSTATRDVAEWQENNPFEMFTFPADGWTPISGMERSYCAIKEQYDQMNSNDSTAISTTTSISTKFGSALPKSQFHIHGLKTATTYNGFLVVKGSNTTLELDGVGPVKGGGKVFQQFNWTTKADDSCQVLTDLEFCDWVAYAVPSSPKYRLDDRGLRDLYDNQARQYYANFSRSLAQIACDTRSDAQYSLVRTCRDCERDYKRWLCSVLIPRCEDWTANDPWLQPRNINAPFLNGSMAYSNDLTAEFNRTHRERFAYSRSRNPLIDSIIQPGPYKEIRPCEDLCFDIVRSCPAKLGFACPNNPAREISYGQRDPSGNLLTCNFPEAVNKLNVKGAAGAVRVDGMGLGLVVLSLTLGLSL